MSAAVRWALRHAGILPPAYTDATHAQTLEAIAERQWADIGCNCGAERRRIGHRADCPLAGPR